SMKGNATASGGTAFIMCCPNTGRYNPRLHPANRSAALPRTGLGVYVAPSTRRLAFRPRAVSCSAASLMPTRHLRTTLPVLLAILLGAWGVGKGPEPLAVVRVGDHYGYINQAGRLVIEPSFDWAWHFAEGYAPVMRDSLWGYIAPDGEVIIPLQFDRALWFSEGLAAVEVDSLWGYIDTAGDLVIPPQFDDTFAFSEGLAVARVRSEVGQRCGYIDRTGQYVIPPAYGDCQRFWYGTAAVRDTADFNDWRLINRDGRTVDSTGVEWNSGRRNALTENEVIYQGGKRGYRDGDGNVIVPPIYDAVGIYVNDRALIEQDGKYGFVDETGRVIVPPRFDQLEHFSEGLASFAVGERWGVIDRNGRVVVEPAYEYVGRFSHGLASFETGSRQGYLNAQGEVV